MSRRTFHLMAACVWMCLFAAVYLYRDQIFSIAELEQFDWLGDYAAEVFLACAALIGLFLHTFLAEHYAPKVPTSEKDLTKAQKRERAEREAALAIKQGRIGTALLVYEEAEMYPEAYKLAEQLGDKPALARLSVRMGHHARARRIYLNLKDYEAAAHTSVLMEEIDTACEYYKQAAEAGKGRLPEAMEAGLWERTRDLATAAALYEKGADFERAADCYHLLGDSRNAVRCKEQAKVIEAYEQKQRGETRQHKEMQVVQQKIQAAKDAKDLEAIGDLLGAGILYREADMMLEAAQAFERFEDWQRAVEAYETAGLTDRADLARMHLDAQKDLHIDTDLPEPKETAPVDFQPIQATLAVPVYIGAGGVPPPSPMARLEVCRRVRRGNFLEAAQFAKTSGDWLMAAAYYEHSGDQLAAADIYRQVGDVNASAWCLEKAGRPLEAAHISVAIGQNDRAVEILLTAIEEGKDARENATELSKLLIGWGKYDKAIELLQKVVAPEGINEANAEIHYEFARRLEDEGALKEAQTLLGRLRVAGAQSDDLDKREKDLTARIAEAEKAEPEAKEKPVPAAPDGIDSMMNVALEEFAPKTKTIPPGATVPPAKETGTTRVFALSPGSTIGLPIADADAGEGASVTGFFGGPEISLFGRVVGDPKPSEVLDSGGQSPIEAIGLDEGDDDDPFAPQQRYEIKSELGRGGMGVVYETLDTVLGRKVALKLILKKAANPDSYRQFLVEARAIALLSHPNVVIIYDIGLIDMQHYIAMEFVDGGNLQSLIEKQKMVPLKDALGLFIGMCQGLQCAHEAGIVHRDIKPQNILLNEKQEVKITDFGLAKIRRKVDAETVKGMLTVSGTPGFIAPEQISGQEPHPRFDVYALGITLFTMLVGKPPHEVVNKTSFLDILQFQKSGEMVPMRRYRPNVPEPVEQVYRYCAAADPEERYQSIDVFLPHVEQIYKALQ